MDRNVLILKSNKYFTKNNVLKNNFYYLSMNKYNLICSYYSIFEPYVAFRDIEIKQNYKDY